MVWEMASTVPFYDGIGAAMKARIDKAGRMVIPKEIRDTLHLLPGTDAELDVVGGYLQVSPVEEEDPEVKMVNGFMVIVGGTPAPGGAAAELRRLRDSLANRTHRDF